MLSCLFYQQNSQRRPSKPLLLTQKFSTPNPNYLLFLHSLVSKTTGATSVLSQPSLHPPGLFLFLLGPYPGPVSSVFLSDSSGLCTSGASASHM